MISLLTTTRLCLLKVLSLILSSEGIQLEVMRVLLSLARKLRWRVKSLDLWGRWTLPHEKVLVASDRIIIAQAHQQLFREILPISKVSFEIFLLNSLLYSILSLLGVINLGEIDHSRCRVWDQLLLLIHEHLLVLESEINLAVPLQVTLRHNVSLCNLKHCRISLIFLIDDLLKHLL